MEEKLADVSDNDDSMKIERQEEIEICGVPRSKVGVQRCNWLHLSIISSPYLTYFERN